jgi:hypothetical protein
VRVQGLRSTETCKANQAGTDEHPTKLAPPDPGAKGETMILRKISSFFLAAAMVTPVLIAGCAVHAHAYYDPYYHDYHPIDGEVVYYNHWEGETHREHKDLKQRDKADQKEYWDWRHKHTDQH